LADGYGPPADVFGLGLILASLIALKPAGEAGFLQRSPRTFFEVVDRPEAVSALLQRGVSSFSFFAVGA
jgi:hypothetical protein